MDKRIEKILPFAFEAVEIMSDSYKNDIGEKYIPSQYNGYISSYGAAIIQSGLLAATSFNSAKKKEGGNEDNKGPQVDKKPLMDAIYYVLKKKRGIDVTVVEGNTDDDTDTLLNFVMQDSNDKRLLKKDILEAATAIKLVIRTYKLKKDD